MCAGGGDGYAWLIETKTSNRYLLELFIIRLPLLDAGVVVLDGVRILDAGVPGEQTQP